MRLKKLITHCMIIAACAFARTADAQNSCTASNLWVNGTFENATVGNQCNVFNPVNAYSSSAPYFGFTTFTFEAGQSLQPTYVNEATEDHTIGAATPPGHYLYVDPRDNTGVTAQVSQMINVSGGSYTFSAWFCSMLHTSYSSDPATVALYIDGSPVSSTLVLNSLTVNNWIQLTSTSAITLAAGVHTVTIVAIDPEVGGHDFAVDDIFFGQDIVTADAGHNKNTCVDLPVEIGGAPTGNYGATCGGSYTYSWSPVAGLSSATVANPMVTQSVPGTYTYTVTVTDLNGQSCTDAVTVTVDACDFSGSKCPVDNLWVDGTFENLGQNNPCNVLNPVNAYANPGAPYFGSATFCFTGAGVILQSALNEVTLDHTTGTMAGTYFYVDPRTNTGATDQLHQVINVAYPGAYTFSAWFASMLKSPYTSAPATVQLYVDGSPVSGTLLINSTTANDWQQLSASVTLLTAGTHTISIMAIDPDIYGHDFAIDDIYFGNGIISANAGNDAVVCANSPHVLGGSPTANFGASCGTYTYNWTPTLGLSASNVANPTLTLAAAGTYVYSVTVTDMNGNICTDRVRITIENCSDHKCEAANLWVDGTFENFGQANPCNILNPVNAYGNPGWPYFGSSTFCFTGAGVVLQSALNEVTLDHTLGTTAGTYFYVDPRDNNGPTEQITQMIKFEAGGSYTFSAWFASMIKTPYTGSPATVELFIDNVSVSSTLTLSGTTANGWIQLVSSPITGYSAGMHTVSIVCHDPVVGGHDFAIDDIFFGQGIITADAGPDKHTCPKEAVTIGGAPTADYGATCGGSYTYNWTPAMGLSSNTVSNPVVSINTPGTYTYVVTVTDLNGQTCTDTVVVVVDSCNIKGNKCEPMELWVDGTFEIYGQANPCNILNSVNAYSNPGWPYFGSSTFVFNGTGVILQSALNEVTADHTSGTATGNYFYVDPRTNSGSTMQIKQTIKTHTSATPFTFSAWFASMLSSGYSSAPATVQLYVDNAPVSSTLLLSGTTANNWIQLVSSPLWLAPGLHDVEIRATDPDVYGHDFAIDDISFRSGILTADAGPDKNVCTGASVALGGAPTADYGATCGGSYTYQWIPAANLSSNTVANPIFSSLVAGTYVYTVIVKDLNNQTCTDQVVVEVRKCGPAGRMTSGNGDNQESGNFAEAMEQIMVYPVPANDLVHVTTSIEQPMKVVIFDAIGQKVWEGELNRNIDINVGNWARGIYHIHMTNTVSGELVVKPITLQ